MEILRYKLIRGSIITMLLACLCLPALPALAGTGIAVGPSTINLGNVMRGTTYDSEISIFNSGDSEMDYTITAEGEAAAWLSMNYQGSPTNRITVPSANRGNVQIKIAIPGDAANGEYTAEVVVSSVPSSEVSGSGQAVSVTAASIITLNVTGTQTISGRVTGIIMNNTEIGSPLVLRVFFENTGNVQVTPSINAKITQSATVIDSFGRSDTSVDASKAEVIDVDWDTAQQRPGDYDAHVVVSLDNKEIHSQDLSFKILPEGTLTKLGEITSLTYEGEPKLDTMLKLEAEFKNTGQADLQANLTAEVYLDGNLVDNVKGEETLVPVGQSSILTAYLKLAKNGGYTIKGYVSYAGKLSEIKQININTGQNSSAPLYTGIGVGALIVLGGVGAMIWHRKRSRLKFK